MARDLKQNLQEQLRFIQNSCDLFDRGTPEEAIRIAQGARVLFHDTKMSTSLLTLLSVKHIQLLSTTAPLDARQLAATSFDETMLALPSFKPLLGHAHDPVELPVHQWWTQIISIYGKENHIRRCDFVLAAANKDGGAHVDSELPEHYKISKEGVWTKTWMENGEVRNEKLPNHHLPILRQIGYEIMNSKQLLALAA